MEEKEIEDVLNEARKAYRNGTIDSILCVDSIRFHALKYIPVLIEIITKKYIDDGEGDLGGQPLDWDSAQEPPGGVRKEKCSGKKKRKKKET